MMETMDKLFDGSDAHLLCGGNDGKQMKGLGQVAYEAYHDGQATPWGAISANRKIWWDITARAVAETCAETAEAAMSDANKYDIADSIRMRGASPA